MDGSCGVGNKLNCWMRVRILRESEKLLLRKSVVEHPFGVYDVGLQYQAGLNLLGPDLMSVFGL